MPNYVFLTVETCHSQGRKSIFCSTLLFSCGNLSLSREEVKLLPNYVSQLWKLVNLVTLTVDVLNDNQLPNSSVFSVLFLEYELKCLASIGPNMKIFVGKPELKKCSLFDIYLG